MLLRSQSATSDQLFNKPPASSPANPSVKARTKRKPDFLDGNETTLRKSVGDLCQGFYGYPARPQQEDTVLPLLKGITSFLLAGTGFGKSRVPELFYLAHEPTSKPIILSINPLKGLGNDQVIEKKRVGLNAVNLTGSNCTTEACNAIMNGDYNFVYVNATLDYLQIINASRGHPKEAGNGHSDFARRYHATTGPNAKLDAVNAFVAEETERQRIAGMPPCDCSNCLPEEAEALWLAQPGLTNDNLDMALRMSASELAEVMSALPEPPPPPSFDSRTVALPCTKDDPILNSIKLEQLVTRLDRTFSTFFYSLFPKEPDLGPECYFDRDMAWDVAKNIDLLHQASDFGAILASETIKGQFDVLFVAYCQWKNECATAAVISEASERRKSIAKASGLPKTPQSCEGARLTKERAEAIRTSLKHAREQAKIDNQVAKANERAAREKARNDTALAKAAAKAARGQVSNRTKRPAEGPLEPGHQSSSGPSSPTQVDNTSDAPQRNRDDRPAALSERINLIILRTPTLKALTTGGGGRVRSLSAKCSAA
ncbi:uncharacterized protein MELLADRAFT_104963 [Melampsora larici-populina 98AG31]|uniref:ATP-dependent DNA helicase sgs1 n=1 Tax=Melampsora larici-populina (strain 98AG31 / pathotype 3-4-7) TaxID=747676 RepID=F4RGM9_MELLP|nr:uncharacterized protein MELLADRAFT_104963 [Melampsora larici-populina 98AG31]EGG08532.1 hypothetical protein MELLADRAFT_104963 [Melampsora larici-populina 98AG31]